MKKTIIEPLAGDTIEFDFDNIKYGFKLTSYENIGGYAKIIIKDMTHGESYLSNGHLYLNDHVFISRWKRTYDNGIDNYRCTHDLVISID